jgi:hypothetical protein
MERHSLFMDWENKYYQIGHTNKSNIQIKWNPHKNSNAVTHRNIKNISKPHMKTQTAPK